ncbi:MAG: cysteine desulfurase [Actinobacteria bacterium HGW-Actinobacteria-7]|jgi:cysteine desulfurase family protein|nr:MAG: cysteine desulfurase [Actinobacteria bacterium HGW-Actinobacteria-7]
MAATVDSPETRIYLDHGATSWPKPPGVIEAVANGLTVLAANPGRGAYRFALDTSRAIHSARRDVATFLGVADTHDLSFQPGCTQAMNLVLLGLLVPGDRVVACSMEHNAVARPLNALAARGVEVVVVDADEAGVVDADEVEAVVAAGRTRAVVCQHAGNVTGAIQPIPDLGDIAHANGALLLVDGAQAGGHLPVDLGRLGADAWACSGHKGLLGPQGVGVLYLAPTCEPAELVSGGTGGGSSEDPLQPLARPERYEAGTPNTPGILGLGASVRFLSEHAEELRSHEAVLVRQLHEGILDLDGFSVLGPSLGAPRVPIVSVVHDRISADRLAFALDRRYGVAARAGLHCAPWAHRTLGTVDAGALRFGLGYGNTPDDVGTVLNALRELVGELT